MVSGMVKDYPRGTPNRDPAEDRVFLRWIIDQVKELAKNPQFIADYEKWLAEREQAKTGEA